MMWSHQDFDDHEAIHYFTDRQSGLKAIIAIHSTHRGPASGGVRFWHYAREEDALTDALRLSRGMSYKNAMAGLPIGGARASSCPTARPRQPSNSPRSAPRSIRSAGAM